MDNRPAELGELTAFRENDAPIQVEFESADLITNPVTVEVWSNDAFYQTVSNSVVDKSITTTLPKELLRAVNARNSKVYIKFGVEYKYSITLKTTLDGSVAAPRLKYVTAPSAGTIRVSTYSDFVSVQEAQAAANSAAASAQAAAESAASAANRYIEMGPWNAATNSPTLTSTAPGPDGNGKYQRYVINTPGTLLININGMASGTFINYGELIAGPGNQWFYNPAESVALTEIANLQPKLLKLTEREGWPQPLWLDAQKKQLIAADEDGSIIGIFKLQEGAVTKDSLSGEVIEIMPGSYDEQFRNEQPLWVTGNNKMLIWYDVAQNVIKGPFSVSDGSITYNSLNADMKDRVMTDNFKRIIQPNPYDTELEDDDMWRGKEIQIPVPTEITGYGYARFGNVNTKRLRGLNDTGQSLTFARIAVPIKWKRFRGTLSGATQPSSTETLPGNPNLPYDFWKILTDGTYGGIVCKAGDVIGQITSYVSAQYILAKKGDYFLMGEAAPGTLAPANLKNGDVYASSGSGSINSIAVELGDLVAYDGGWGKVSYQKEIIPSGNYFAFQCSNANDWGVRRTDKGTTSVLVKGKGQGVQVRRRVTDTYRLLGNSMPGHNGFGTALFSAMGASGVTQSYGGATAEQVSQKMQEEIRKTDLYAGSTHIFWPYENNFVLGQAGLVGAKNACHELVSMVGAKNKRFCFISMAGARGFIFDAGLNRLVCETYEGSKAKTGLCYDMEMFFEEVYPKNFFNTRLALLASAVGRTQKDPQFPGMTEEQVAATYGIAPFSYHFNWAAVPFTAAQLNFIDYRANSTGLTGGNPYDYYIQNTGTATVGDLIVNIGGVWTNYSYPTYDPLHFMPAGVTALVNQFVLFNQTAKI